MVYHYDKATNLIKNFLKLKTHSFPNKYFIPEESEANTQVFLKYGNIDEITIIENKLVNYLYDFSKVKKRSHGNVVFDDNPKSVSYSYKKN